MSIISYCVIVIELLDGEPESLPLHSLSYTSGVYKDMSSRGKGVPITVRGSRTKVIGQRKVQEFRVSTYASVVSNDQNQQKPDQRDSHLTLETKHFTSGNPFVEVTKGILHLYKDNDRLFMEPGSKSSRSEMLCVLAIPSSISCTEFLNFISPFKWTIEHIKIIRDTSPSHYMALLKFKEQTGADTFYLEFNGKSFNSFDDNICLLAYVSKVETSKQSDGGGLPITGHTELPTCAVCLERMDESVDGLLTILCNHSFHASCLSKWSDSGCPVCRYIQTPEMVAKNACYECNSKDQLWICLICGHVGCGRYLHGHAYKHFCETEHAYAIQPDNNRVWDYIGDNFVHRLYQSKDGKPVEVSGRRFEGDTSGLELGDAEEKVDNMQLEFTHLLTSQLEAQRTYFEQKMKEMESDKKSEHEAIIAKLEQLESDKQESDTNLGELSKDRRELEKKLVKANGKYERTLDKLDEQVALTNGMTQDLDFYKNKLKDLERDFDQYRLSMEKEVSELRETVRDLSIYIETEKVISQSPYAAEARQGSVQVPIPSPTPTSSRGHGHKKRHGK